MYFCGLYSAVFDFWNLLCTSDNAAWVTRHREDIWEKSCRLLHVTYWGVAFYTHSSNQIHSPWLGYIVYSGVGCRTGPPSYAAGTKNPMPELTLSPQLGTMNLATEQWTRLFKHLFLPSWDSCINIFITSQSQTNELGRENNFPHFSHCWKNKSKTLSRKLKVRL